MTSRKRGRANSLLSGRLGTAYTYVDLFAGCGGLSEGFEASGHFAGAAHVEWERAPAATLALRLRERWGYEDSTDRVFDCDIRHLTGDPILETRPDPQASRRLTDLLSRTGMPDIVIGGPPCQAYSVAGRVRDAHGMKYDYRNYLFESYVRFVRRVKPICFLFENVPGILSATPGGVPIPERIADAFSRIGYGIAPVLRDGLFDLTAFGVPQRRRRLIIFGVDLRRFGARAPAYIDRFHRLVARHREAEPRTVRMAISDLPPLYPVRSPNGKASHERQAALPDVPDHIPRYHNQRDITLFRRLAQDIADGRMEFVSPERLKLLYTEVTGRSAAIHKYYVLRWNEPSNTIPAHLYKDGLRHIHPDPAQARSITVREAARLQSFGDDFTFVGSLGDRYKMIGNAVPPAFSRVLADSLAQWLDVIAARPSPTLGD